MKIHLKEPDKMNLIGFFFRDLLENNLKKESCRAAARQTRGSFLFNASGMLITLVFQGESIEIHPGTSAKISSKITGQMNDLLDVALGVSYLKLLLAGKIRIGGNIFKLLKLLQVLRS